MQVKKCLTKLIWQNFKVTADENYQHLSFHEHYFLSFRKSTIQFLREWLDSEKIHFKDNSFLKNKKNYIRRLYVIGAVTFNQAAVRQYLGRHWYAMRNIAVYLAEPVVLFAFDLVLLEQYFNLFICKKWLQTSSFLTR